MFPVERRALGVFAALGVALLPVVVADRLSNSADEQARRGLCYGSDFKQVRLAESRSESSRQGAQDDEFAEW